MNSCQNTLKLIQSCSSVKKINSHLLTTGIQLEGNAVASYQYSRRETIELNPVPADITEGALEENVCKALSLTGVNVVPKTYTLAIK